LEVNKMPNRDKTGPEGLGPMTGQRFGRCASGQRQGLGRGYGGRLRQGRNANPFLQEITSEKPTVQEDQKTSN
jgi:hypothetical protein